MLNIIIILKLKQFKNLCITAVVNLFAVSNFVTVYSKLNFEATFGAKLQKKSPHFNGVM